MPLTKVKARSSVDYMLRTTQQHHVQLSSMADQKANIIIAFGSVMVTVSLTQLRTGDHFWGFSVLGLSVSVAIVLAILSLIPRIRHRNPRNVTVPMNPLFFGHFAEMTEQEFLGRMGQVMETDAGTYEAMLRDLYQIGMVLHKKKYFYLTLSYRAFLVGICLSLLTFLVEVVASRI